MIIQHNMASIYTNKELNYNEKKLSNKTERLASGYRINRSADDTAGLSISEKMRCQIRGLDQASRNALDGISLIQTADGALGEVDSVLHRMEELTVQAANDTNQNVDRDTIQGEIDQLRTEINRISRSTTFNDIPLLRMPQLIDFKTEDVNGIKMTDTYTINNKSRYGTEIDFSNINADNITELIGKEFTITCSANCSQTFNFSFTDANSNSSSVSGSTDRRSLSIEIGCLNNPQITNGTDIATAINDIVLSKQTDLKGNNTFESGITIIGHANGFERNGSKLIFYSISGGPPYSKGMGELQAEKMIVSDKTLTLQTGANSEQSVPIELRTITTGTLGLSDLPVNSFKNAGESLTAIHSAVEQVSEYRAYLGAIENRLEHTISNVNVASENTQASESRLRDADMADEMVDYSASNVLVQSAQSILAQSNQSAQSVVQLLQQ